MSKHLFAAALAVLSIAANSPVFAAAEVFVGYADDLRPSPFFPTPWCGSGVVDLAAASGDTTGCTGGSAFDSGAVGVKNTGVSPITINALTVTLRPNDGPVGFTIWNTFLPAVINPGQWAIFAQTSGENFDTSDFGVINGLNSNSPTNNCSVGAFSTEAICLNNTPVVAITIDGVTSTLSDTAHVLDTGGYDTVNSNPCVGGNNPTGGNTPGNCNESLQWRDIGTTGIENPGGGTAPEPGAIALLGAALGALGVARWRRPN
jgi:hypothetical protein